MTSPLLIGLRSNGLLLCFNMLPFFMSNNQNCKHIDRIFSKNLNFISERL